MGLGIPSSYFDVALTLVLALIGWFLTGLREELKAFNEQQKRHTDALNALAVTIGRDYVTRSEHDQDMREVRGDLDRVATNEREDVARLHARFDALGRGAT